MRLARGWGRALGWGLALAAGSLLAQPARAGAASPAVPFGDRISSADRAHLAGVMEQAFVAGEVSVEPYPARSAVFEFLLDHPVLAGHVAHAAGATRYRIWRSPEGLALDDGAGTTGRFRVLHAETGARMIHAHGRHVHWLFPQIRGEALVIIRYHFRPDGAGATVVETSFTGYVRLERGLLTGVLRVFAPLLHARAMRGARDLLGVFAKVSRAIQEDPAAVCEQVAARPGVKAEDLRALRQVLACPGGPGVGPPAGARRP